MLFGAGTPLAKLLLDSVSPWLLAGLLYAGSGLGLTCYRRLRHSPGVRLPRTKAGWFLGAVAAGGVVAPVLLMFGLTGMPASGTSLLLNAEGVFTALLAWFVFRENFGRRIALGMLAIVAGALPYIGIIDQVLTSDPAVTPAGQTVPKVQSQQYQHPLQQQPL